MPRLLRRALLLSSLLGGGALALGHLISPHLGWGLLTVGLGLQLLFHLRHLERLENWSRQPGGNTLEGDGTWDDVFSRLYRHEKELRRNIDRRENDLARFAAAIQALTDGIVLLDDDNRILWCNGVAERLLSLNALLDRGQSVVNLVRQPEFVAYLENADYAQPLILAAGHDDRLSLAIHLVGYGDGQRLMQVKDVTAARRVDETRRDFVANVSHELRTPLTVLAGFIETLRELELAPEEKSHFLGLMAEQSDRMQRIVQDLLTLSTLESAPPPPAGERIDMQTMIGRIERDARALSAGRHDITVTLEGNADLFGSESEMASALGNLVSNAVRYTPQGGKIQLAWRFGIAGAEFSVEDTGIGIDPALIPRLTERFYRVDCGRSRETGGTGLGLAIVKHALIRHQARLEISSQPGKGSRFAVRFPAARVVVSQ